MDIPEPFIIHDTRIGKDFKGITICGYKRKDVLNAFQNSMINNKLEDAIRWCVELHSTGLNLQIWESIKNIYFKYIHTNNPKLFFYLLKREKEYQNIIKVYPKKHEIFSRNNQEIRNLYAELTAICSLAKKNNIFLPKSLPIVNNKSFQKDDIQRRMISKDLDKIIDYIFNSTTQEIKLGLNEIINNIYMKNGTFQNCIYWYLWIEKIENSKKNDATYNEEHWLFVLWNIILKYSEENIENNNLIYIKKLHLNYTNNFKSSDITKKKYYFFIAFYIIKNNIIWNINLFQNEHFIIQTNANINIMYGNVIKNIESSLSVDTKQILYKKYNNLLYNICNTNNININRLKKIADTHLDNDINIITSTKHPEYNSLINKKETLQQPLENKLISTNMTQRNINECKEEEINKKLDAFTQFVVFKKNITNMPSIETTIPEEDNIKEIMLKKK